ncbi:putative N6-adenine methyltransferase-domain-containing protein [Mycena filopes]|nr:putative N6-adenine methyltransferase-domain-containing protein [Mycena filopes]
MVDQSASTLLTNQPVFAFPHHVRPNPGASFAPVHLLGALWIPARARPRHPSPPQLLHCFQNRGGAPLQRAGGASGSPRRWARFRSGQRRSRRPRQAHDQRGRIPSRLWRRLAAEPILVCLIRSPLIRYTQHVLLPPEDPPHSGQAPPALEPSLPSTDRVPLSFAAYRYTTPFAMRFARILHALCTPDTAIAFLCCPTAFVAFQHLKPLRNARLLEFDGRFGVLSPRQYVPYDMEEPTRLPADLTESFDIVVVDPPFLNEYTNTHIVTTLRQITRPTAKVLVITSTSVTSVLEKLYDSAPVGPLRKTKIEVEHGQLRNDFACWGSWVGAEDLGEGDLGLGEEDAAGEEDEGTPGGSAGDEDEER